MDHDAIEIGACLNVGVKLEHQHTCMLRLAIHKALGIPKGHDKKPCYGIRQECGSHQDIPNRLERFQCASEFMHSY